MSLAPGSGTPMIPVEEGKISCWVQPKVAAALAQTSRQVVIPASPVAQLALPALTATTLTRPCDCRRFSRPTMMGAATTRLLVNMAAAVAPWSATAIAKSGLPLGLRPALTAANWNPDGRRKSGRCGDEVIDDYYCINRKSVEREGGS